LLPPVGRSREPRSLPLAVLTRKHSESRGLRSLPLAVLIRHRTLADVDPLFWAAPSVGVPGYLMPSENTPNYRTTNNYQLQDSVIWNRKNHTFKFGGDLKDVREYMFFTGGNGSTNFANRYTGNNVADFLLGLPSNVNKTARASEWNSRVQYLGLFAQDDWKVPPKLTLNLGLRYEFETALKQAGNEGLGFDPRTGEVLISRNIRNRASIENFYKNVRQDIKIRFVPQDRPYDTDFNNFGPRLGFAYALRPDVVVRGGYGIFYSSPEIQSLASSNDFAPITLRPIWNANPTRPDIGYNPEDNVSPALANSIFGGWGVRGITVLQTGLPQSPSMNLARLGTCSTACTARPDRIADGNLPKDERTLNRFYDPAAFRLLAAGGADRRVGSAGRNILIAPGFNNTDFQLFKSVKFKERHGIEFRWEMFNAFNHTNWGAPNVNLESPDFVRITSTAPPRIMQFVLRYDF
jgi:hypothetical protein